MHEFYGVPRIVPSVPADDPNGGVPSDHCTAIAAPHSSATVQMLNEYKLKTTMPLPDSGIREFGQWIIQANWDSIEDGDDPTCQAQSLENMISAKVDEYLPCKTFKCSQKDKKWMNAE